MPGPTFTKPKSLLLLILQFVEKLENLLLKQKKKLKKDYVREQFFRERHPARLRAP